MDFFRTGKMASQGCGSFPGGWAGAAWILCLGLATNVSAQQVVQLNRADIKGKVTGVAAGSIEITVENGNRWVVNLEGKLGPLLRVKELPAIAVKGIGTPKILGPGMSVYFPAKLDRKNATIEDIAKLELFSPTPNTAYGLFPLGGETEPAGPKKKGPLPEVREVRVTGSVTGLKNNLLTLAIQGGTVKAKLAEGCLVNFETSDYSKASLGDPVEASIAYASAPNAVALQVTVTKAGILGSELEKPKRNSTAKGLSEKGNKDKTPADTTPVPFAPPRDVEPKAGAEKGPAAPKDASK